MPTTQPKTPALRANNSRAMKAKGPVHERGAPKSTAQIEADAAADAKAVRS